jgi:two-component system chemotaxis response regulator CheY
MVNMNGIEALERIRDANPKAKIIMISSNSDKKKVLDCIMAGASDYILKPFEPKRVMTVVRSVLEK